MDMEKVYKAYERFVTNKDKNGVINIYLEYEKDLDIMLQFIKDKLYVD